jgi:hypothetical protein
MYTTSHSGQALKTLILIVCGLFFSAPFSKASDACRTPLSVKTAVRRAQLLDGKTICLKGWEYPIVAPGSAGRTVFVNELVPSGASRSLREKRVAVGLVEGSSDSAPENAQYIPDSFKKIDDLWEEGPSTQPVIEVVLRGIIVRNKGLANKVAAQLPSDDPFYDPLRRPSHSVEFIILEVISAKKVRLH